jgi:DNA-binding MltR family transcriptional regulator
MDATTTSSFEHADRETFAREGIAFGKELWQETDRGAALVGLAFIDEMLKRLFEAKMLQVKIAKKLLEYPRALSSAAARSDVAYALGWIGARTYGDLTTLRQIRNKFAHAHESVKFDDPAKHGWHSVTRSV